MDCKVCGNNTKPIYRAKVLNKYEVLYHQCTHCQFVQTDTPFWLSEAYESAITALDIGLISRNVYLQKEIPVILDGFFPKANYMLDYGGGYGIFVRMMRDLGYNFFRQDMYCENLFAKYFDKEDCPVEKVDVLTSFEVFEHLENPMEEIQKMFVLADNIIFSTELIPANEAFSSWWYVSPLIGQHIAFYNLVTLNFIADKFGKKLYSNGRNLHVFSSENLSGSTVKEVFSSNRNSLLQRAKRAGVSRIKPVKRRESLLQSDYQFIEKKLKGNN